MHHFLLQHALPQPLLHIPPLFAGKRQGGDVSVDEDVVNPIRFSSCAQLNARRLWNAGTVHAAFHGLADILLQLSINVVCIQETQETHAPDFASLPGDQPFVYDGPSNTGGCEAGFLFTSQSGCQRFLVSRTLNAFGGGWCQVLCASAHCMLRTLEWMISSALFSGKSWWRQ